MNHFHTSIFFTVTLLAACKKLPKESAVHSRLSGRWRQQYTMWDTNGNGIRDSADYLVQAYTIFSLSADGTGFTATSPTASYGTPVHWLLLNDDADLRMASAGPSGVDTVVYHIDTLTATAMRLSRPSKGLWYFFERQ